MGVHQSFTLVWAWALHGWVNRKSAHLPRLKVSATAVDDGLGFIGWWMVLSLVRGYTRSAACLQANWTLLCLHRNEPLSTKHMHKTKPDTKQVCLSKTTRWKHKWQVGRVKRRTTLEQPEQRVRMHVYTSIGKPKLYLDAWMLAASVQTLESGQVPTCPMVHLDQQIIRSHNHSTCAERHKSLLWCLYLCRPSRAAKWTQRSSQSCYYL